MSRHCSAPHANCRGFTLVEAIVVIAILSIIMMAIMSFIIPTRHSMNMQAQVTDVQSNLNLAVDVMTRDLLMAGFLVDPAFDPPITHANCPDYWKGDNPGDDMQPGPIFWQGNDTTEDNDDLTIRTRIVGKAFAVMGGDAASMTVTPTHLDMLRNFCDGTTVKTAKVRIFNPITMTDPNCASGNYDCELVPATVAASLSNVTACTTDDFTVDRTVAPSAVIIGTRNDVLPMQTIRYRINNGALERIVDGNTQVLARGVTAVEFDYGQSSSGTINRVDVTLTGVINAIKPDGDAQLSQKTRSVATTVNLRNVF